MSALPDFDFLSWVDRVAHFRETLRVALIELGADPGDAFLISRSDAVCKKQSIVALYQDYGSAYRELLDAYVMKLRARYDEMKDKK